MPRIHKKSAKSAGARAPGNQKRDLRTGVRHGADAIETNTPERLSGVLVLNQNFEPLNICSIQRGMTLLLLEKVEVLRFSDQVVRSAEDEFMVPSVLRLNEAVKRPMPELKISRKSVLARDSYTCVYCGSRETLTLDHVFPRHRGGETTWENVVCSCLRCNNKKGARTPSECGMRLPSPPRKPRYVPYISFPRFVSAVRRPEWREFLEGFGKGLDGI